MPDNNSMRHDTRLAIRLSVALLIIVTIVFAVAFVVTSMPKSTSIPAIAAQTYATEVAAALYGASAVEGEALVEAFQCHACHILGEGRIAPLFDGIADRAETRRPPLSATQYLYESIISPGAYLVEGYANAMPANFADRLTQAQIGHIIAFLLSKSGDVHNL